MKKNIKVIVAFGAAILITLSCCALAAAK